MASMDPISISALLNDPLNFQNVPGYPDTRSLKVGHFAILKGKFTRFINPRISKILINSINSNLVHFLLNTMRRDKGNMVKILLADDDNNFGTVIKNELEEERHAVDVVSDGVEAVLRFINNVYDFVLLDIRMPRLNGTDALRIIKRINPEVPAITFSGKAGDFEMAESVRCGAIKCFRKPFEIAQLKKDIRSYVLK